MKDRMHRRTLLAAAPALAMARPAIAQPVRTLRFVPIADLSVLDPVVTTTYITRNHGYLVWDTLYGLDAAFRPQPQMAEGHAVEADGRRVSIRLREGLRFHDGAPVTAADCVASIRRWGARDALGQTLLARTDALEAPDDRTIRFRLASPFPALFQALAKTSPSVAFMMPAHLAATDPATAIRTAIGSGPFRFVAEERVPGVRTVYERFAGYVPRPGDAASGTAGPKVAHVDRVEWVVLPDPATAAAALQRGEVDWWEFPTPDLAQLLRRTRGVVVENLDPTGFMGVLRLNHLHPPFDDPAVRRALLPAIAQADFMAAVAGTDPDLSRTGVGFFPPGAPMAGDAQAAHFGTPRDLSAARAALAGRRVTVIGPTDYPNVQALTEVAVDLLRRVGASVDYAPGDWASVVQRRANRSPPAQGGWNMLATFFSGQDFFDPAVHLMLRANGTAAWPGWPSSPAIEALREEWFAAEGEPARALAARIEAQAFADLPYVPLGQFFQPTAYRSSLTGVLKGGVSAFWNVRKA
jgi:peptide/nickel transport system substrate-binding protein